MLFFQLNKKSINIGFLYKKTQNIKKIKYSPIKKIKYYIKKIKKKQ